MAASKSVAVVVLGDIGRSPRMQYHCMSLSRRCDEVSLVGYAGERCVPAVDDDPRIRRFHVAQPFQNASRKFFLFYAPLKVVMQLLSLLWTLLFCIPRPTHVLVQAPPSIPAIFAVWVACTLRNSKLVIDWHNFGYTILGLSLGRSHPFVRLSYIYERAMAQRAHAHLCVTKAMREWLRSEWGVQATVLYDRAPDFFRRTSVPERHALFKRLGPQLAPAAEALDMSMRDGGEETVLTRARRRGPARLRDDRPFVVVSSTSWTADEDFSYLLDALVEVEQWIARAVEQGGEPRRVLCIVTGKGPQRSAYEAKIAALRLRHVAITTMWLEPSDYPLLLGSADLGVSLHTSSSGLDLPMKVVDMFGAGVPVCAIAYPCLEELVQHGSNGYVFRSATELADQIQSLLEGFPHDIAELDRLSQGVAKFQGRRWEDNWGECAAPHFECT